MVKRLLDAGHSVTGYNRTRAKAQWLLDTGMKWAETPRAVADSAEVVFSMVSDTAALQAITAGTHGIVAGLAAGKIYIDMSTVSPAASRDIAQQVAAKGAHMLDAPVSGSVITLEEGKLSFMVGGDRVAFEQARSILEAIGPKVTYVGGNHSEKAFDPELAARRANPFALERVRYYTIGPDGTLTLKTRHDNGKDAATSRWQRGG